MGNSQSRFTSPRSGRRVNRLSKAPKSAVLSPNDTDLADTELCGHHTAHTSWLSPEADRPPAPQRRSPEENALKTRDLEALAGQKKRYERDLEAVSDQQPSSTFSTRESKLKRRQSAPEGAIHSFDVQQTSGHKPPVQTSKVDRRATIQDSTELAANLRAKRDEPLPENQESKRYSAFRRESLRTPGIATRVSEKAFHNNSSPKVSDICHRVSRDDLGDELKDTPSGVSWLDLDSPKSPAGDSGRKIPSLRASTPNNFEYSYLGPFRPGSLHVVNGAASPASSGRMPRSLTEATSYDMSRGAGSNIHSPLIHNQTEVKEPPSVTQHPYVDENAASTAVETIPNDPTNGVTMFDLSHNISIVPLADNGQITPAYDEMGNGKYVARHSTLPSRITSPHLVVTSKTTAMEDDLFDEDEAVDTSTPENPEEHCTSGSHGHFTENSPRDSTPNANATQNNTCQTSNARPNNLGKSDSGYSSTSSKGPSQHVCGYFCINHHGNGYGTSNYMNCNPIEANVNENSIHTSSKYPLAAVSAINDRKNSLPTHGISQQSAEPYSCSNNPEWVSSPYTSPANPRHMHWQHMPAETPSSFQGCQQDPYSYEQRDTHKPQQWPLRNDLIIPDPNPAERSQLFTEQVARRSNTLRPPRRRSDRATLKKPLPFVQLGDLQQSAAPRSSSSTDTSSTLSHQHPSSSGKYVTRIKSLVSVRARKRQHKQQQRHEEQSHLDAVYPSVLVDDYRMQQQEHPHGKKPQRNKLRRKSTHFSKVNVAV